MQCPVCKQVRLEPATLADDLPARTCPTCGGHFVEIEEYLDWRERHKPAPAAVAAPAPELPVHDSGPGKLCPDCGAFLIRYEVGHGAGFALDRCGRCGGVWLDANEWEDLTGLGLAAQLHLVFSEAWQSQVKRQEREGQYRQAVRKILDAKLSQYCSPEEADRIKQFQDWVSRHPHGREIQAYLRSVQDL